MIISVEELRRYIDTDEEDQALEARLQALELLIRGYTNNGFAKRGYARIADVVGGEFTMEAAAEYETGDTIQVMNSSKNDGLYTVKTTTGNTFTVNERTRDEIDVYVTLVEYPMDVKMGAVNLMKWEMNNRDKVGVQSETISRHSVTYFDMGNDNSIMGYPKALMGFLKPYMKARFGRGIRA